MITILAEKPSVARDIARIVGATQQQEGYLTGNNYHVTWAFGHLITLAMPIDYGIEGYEKEDLPILPNPFKLKIREVKSGKDYKTDPSAKKQLSIIAKLFQQASKIIVATDAGREGELIFRYIYKYLHCKKPFERLWISSLTDKAIKDGLANLKPGNLYDALYCAGKARSEADWLVGINGSRALCLSAQNSGYSVGRVQTPTLAMVCKRYLEHKNFQSTPFWKLQLHTEKANLILPAHSHSSFTNRNEAETLLSKLQIATNVSVQSVQQKTVKSNPPLLYDLTSLQKEANQKYGYSASQTLSIAQSLYEKKVATYPRTGSRYISEDVFEQIPTLLRQFENDPDLGTYALSLREKTLNTQSVNATKVTDHHAILPTENSPHSLSKEEQTLYQMLVVRLLEAFSDIAMKEVTTVTLQVGGEFFTLKGNIPLQMGWREVVAVKEKEKEEDATILPPLTANEQLPIKQLLLTEHRTKPQALYNESSLLSAMENAGQEVTNEEAKIAMKDCGIGTPATRASIIETLLSRAYIERVKKTIVPTVKGLQVYELVKNKYIADARMTGEWEFTLNQIEQRKIQVEEFHRSIENYTEQITQELLQLDIPQSIMPLYECPQCLEQAVVFYPKIAKCQTEGCEFKLFRTVCKKHLSDNEILCLLKTGKSPLLKGLKSKAGKSFDAYLILQKEGTTAFEFPETNKGNYSPKNRKCRKN